MYGAEEFRKSRSMAGGMTGGFVLLALSLCMMTPAVKALAPPKTAPSVMLMRVVRPEPAAEVKPVEPDAMRKLLSPESEVTIPVPPPPVVKPRTPPREAPKTVAPEPVKPKPAKKVPPVKKPQPVARHPQKAVPPSAPVGETADVSPAGTGTAVSSAGGAAPAVSGTQERPDDKSKALGIILDALNRHKRYPKQARRIGAEGTVQLLVTVSADGKISACSLGKGSGFGALDAATERLGEKLVGLDVPSARGGKGFQVLVPVRYSLKDA